MSGHKAKSQYYVEDRRLTVSHYEQVRGRNMVKPEEILKKACQAIETLATIADEYHGLFPSIVDLDTLTIPEKLPPNIPGQRNEDRAFPGSNLMHDKYVLNAMYGLSQAGYRHYAKWADRYIQRFAVHCTNTTTGLFPWGEHAFWDIKRDCIGNSFPLAYDWWTEPAIHDHLSATPFWLWQKLWEYNPVCVERFAEGLDYHWREGEPLEYCRHAHIEIHKRPPREARSCDFPRHGGFYVMDWSFAYAKTARPDFLAQIHKMLDYWWEKRDRKTGLLPLESKTPPDNTAIYGLSSPGQAMSLAMSLFETADFLDDYAEDKGIEPGSLSSPAVENTGHSFRETIKDLSTKMRERAEVYASSFLTLPHDLENDVWVDSTRLDTGEIASTMRCWGSVYGSGTAAGAARLCVGFYRMTGNENFFQFARSVGRRYLREPLPQGTTVPISDAASVLLLLEDLYEITGNKDWLQHGLYLAGEFIPVYFTRSPLPRGEAHIDFYDSQMGTGLMIQALARLALLAENQHQCPIKSDYSAR